MFYNGNPYKSNDRVMDALSLKANARLESVEKKMGSNYSKEEYIEALWCR